MTQVIEVHINPWEEDKPVDYILKLEDIKYIKKHDYVQYEDEEDWFYAIEFYLEEKLQPELNSCFVTEEFKTPEERDVRVDQLIQIINIGDKIFQRSKSYTQDGKSILL